MSVTARIDLDSLERRCTSRAGSGPTSLVGLLGVPDEDVLARVRAVRAAQNYRHWHDGYNCVGPDGQCEWDHCEQAKDLVAALAPFREQT